MDVILRNLSDPSWWFTGLFFVLVALAMPSLFRRLQRVVRRTGRGMLARSRKRVKNARHDPLAITAAIGKANAQFTVFLLLAFGYGLALLLLAAPYARMLVPLAIALSAPVFVIEIAWLNTDSYVKEVLKARARFLRRQRSGANVL